MKAPKPTKISEEREFEGKVFPLTLIPNDENPVEENQLCAWIRSNQKVVDDYLRDHKAILFRGFLPGGENSHEDFHEFVIATELSDMPYIGGAAVRSQLTSRVFTANESPSSEKIPFHHEMAQTPDPPTHLFFYCATQPSSGGETPLLVSSEVYDKMRAIHPVFMQRLEDEGVRYVRVMPEYDDPSSAIGRGWRSTFRASTRGNRIFSSE